METRIIKTIHAQYGPIHTQAIADIVRALREYQPDKPEDETQGFIAYNVSGKARMKMKTGRFLIRKLKLNVLLSDSTVQRLASEINADLFPGFGIRFDTGDAIMENYRDDIGGSSCMSSDCAEYVGLYVENPTRFSQLIIEQNGDSVRAMVFHLDSGETMCSKIYATCEYLKDRIREYSTSKNWLPRGSAGTMSNLNYTDGEVPYMDDLQSYRIDNGLLTIGTCINGAIGKLTNQDGNIEQGTPCVNCDDIIDEEFSCCNEAGETFCEECYNEIYSYCEKCEEAVLNEDTVCVDEDTYWCNTCAKNHATQCEDCNEYSTDTVDVDGDEHCRPCAEQYSICDDCGEYTKEVDQCGYCTDCEGDHADEIPCRAETALLFN